MDDSLYNVTDQIVTFTIDGLVLALPLFSVRRVIHAVEITNLPKAPDIVTGIINVRGQVIPVVDIRKRIGLRRHEIIPSDDFIIADAGKLDVAIIADAVDGVEVLIPGQLSDAGETLPFAEYLSGVAKTEKGLILIYDLRRFLSLEEENELFNAIRTHSDESLPV